MGTTLHYIDKEWQLHQHTIGFQFLGGESHNTVHLANNLIQIIQDLCITNGVLAIVSYNASVNMALDKHLLTNVFGPKWNAEQYRVPCLTHVIALVSNQFMKELQSNPKMMIPSHWHPKSRYRSKHCKTIRQVHLRDLNAK